MKHTNKTLSILATAILTACGGGGSTSSTGGSPASFTASCTDGSTRTSATSEAAAQAMCPVTPASVPIVTSVPVATYAAGSQEKAAFDYLNNARSTCGFGLLAQDAKLDVAAANHANYMNLNNVTSHNEALGSQGFTGDTHIERTRYASYLGTTGEVLATGHLDPQQPNTFAILNVRSLLSAPYHLYNMMVGWRDMGVGAVLDSSSLKDSVVMNFGSKPNDANQQPDKGGV